MIDTQEKIERLTMLKDMLDRHEELFPNLGFDMGPWHCGTAACALGSAACYAPFKRKGLSLKDDSLYGKSPAYEYNRGFEAGAEFFGITKEESRELFASTRYSVNGKMPVYQIPTKDIPASMVSERVQNLIDKTIVETCNGTQRQAM